MSETNSRNSHRSTPQSSGLSRRSFINIAIGSITMVPAMLAAAPASSELGPTPALAEEATKDAATLTVAKSNQLNIVVFDVTGGSKKRIPNAAVTVWCPNTKQNYELNTGSSGVTLFDIEKLADSAGLKKNPKQYTFYGKITIKANGYRTFRSGIMQFKGGTSVQVVTRRIEPGVPYPALCTFDQYDVMYTENDFVRSSENNVDHALRIELENAGTKPITMTLATTDGTAVVSQTVTPSSGVATFEVKGKYLLHSNSQAFPAGKKFLAKYSQDGKNFQHDVRLTVSLAPKDAQGSGTKSNVPLASLLFNSLDMNMALTFPQSIPYIGGTTIKPPWPDMPVHVGFDPFGYVRISVRTPEWGYKKSSSMSSLKEGAAEEAGYESDTESVSSVDGAAVKKESSWKTQPRKGWSEQWSDLRKQWTDAQTNTKNAWNNKGGEDGDSKVINWSKSLSFTFMAQVTGWGEWRTSEQYWRLGIAVQGVMAFKFTYMMNTFAGPVPILIQAGVDLSVVVGYAFAAKTPGILDFSKYEWDFGTDGLTISIKFIPYFSIGLGIKGLASASLKIAATLAIFMGFGALGLGSSRANKNNLPMPHVTMGASINGTVVVEIWLITYEIPLSKGNKGWGWPKLYDNWRKGNPWNTTAEGAFRGQSDTLLPMADEQLMKLEEFMNSGTVISEGNLNGIAETVAQGVIKPQSDGIEAMAEGDDGDYEEYYVVEDDPDAVEDDLWVAVYDQDYHEADGSSEDDYPYPSMDIWYVPWSEAKNYEGMPTELTGNSVSGQSATGEGGKGISAQSTQESLQPESNGAGATSGKSAGSASLKEEAMKEDSATGTGAVAASVAMAESSLSLSTGEVSKSGNGNGNGGAGSEGEMGTESVTPGQQQAPQSSGNEATNATPGAEGEMGTQEVESGAQLDAANASGNDGLQAQSDGEMGSAEPTLTAQATTTQKVLSPNSRKKGAHEYQNIDMGSSVKERGPELGLVPQQDVRLMSGVLADTRSKVVTIQGVPVWGKRENFTFLFRLGTVDYGSDGTRSRVMFSLLDPKYGVDNYNRYIDFTYSKEKPGLIWLPGYDKYRPYNNSFTFVSKCDAKRTDYFDYDFDVYVEQMKPDRNDQTHVRLHFVLVSGTRPKGDKSSVADILSNPVITYLRYELVVYRSTKMNDEPTINIRGWANSARTVQVNDLFKKTETIKKFPAHSITCPQINRISDTPVDEKRKSVEGNESSALMITFLDRAATSPAKVLSDNSSEVSIFMGLMFAGLGDSQMFTIMKADDLCKDSNLYPLDDCTIREMSCSARINAEGDGLKNKHLVMFKGSKKAHYFFLETHANVKHKGNQKLVENPKYNPNDPNADPGQEFILAGTPAYFAPDIISIKRYQVGDDIVLPKLINWPGRKEYLGTLDGKLQRFWWVDADTKNPKLEHEAVGPESFDIAGFGVDPTGNFVYYPSSRDGVPGYDTASEAKVDGNGSYTEAEFKESEAVHDYRIMACKLHGDKANGEHFSDPFVFAELDHAADLLELVSSTPACLAFIATSVTDGLAGKGDVWYTAMPNVRSITVLACEALGEYVFPGEKAVLKVSVRNDGNTYLSGFTARMRDLTAGKTGNEEVRVTFSANTLMQSGFNPLKEGSTTGELQNVEPDYALAPGKSAVYQVEFTVPNDWKGTRKVTVLASDATVAASDKGIVAASEDVLTAMSDELYAQAEDVYAYDADWADDVAPYDNLDVIALEEEEFYDAPIQVPTDGGGVVNADGSVPSESGGASGASRQALPRTADGSSLGPIATAAGVAGAAMIAYSRRRARIEKQLRDRGIDLDDD